MTAAQSVSTKTADAGQQWMTRRLRLRRDLQFSCTEQQARPVYLIEDHRRCKFFYVGVVEFHFIQRLDGTRTCRQAFDETVRQFPEGGFDSDSMQAICNWLIQTGLLSADGPGLVQRLVQVHTLQKKHQRMSWLNPLMIRIPLFRPDGLLTRLAPKFGWLFSPWMAAIWTLVAAVAFREVTARWQQICSKSDGLLSPDTWLWTLVGWFFLKVVHETAHGIACKKYGGHIGAAGIQFILFTPLAFIDVTSSWRFRSRWQRIVVGAAGMYAELFLAFLAALVWVWNPDSTWGDLCFRVFVLSGVTTVLFNANPLMRYDGYYILSDLLDIPNLYQRAQQKLGSWILRLISSKPLPNPQNTRTESIVLSVYGVAALFWRITLTLSILLVASSLFYGAGIVLAIIGLVMWYGPKLVHLAHWLKRVDRSKLRQRPALLIGAITATIFFVFGVFLAAPAVKSAPCLVQYKDESVILRRVQWIPVGNLRARWPARRSRDHAVSRPEPRTLAGASGIA